MKVTRSSNSDEHTLAGAYAMDAVSEPDGERFERHLAGCQECAREIASLREATALLGTAAAEPVPAGLKERIMAAAAVTRQQPPAGEAEPVPHAYGSWARAGTWVRSLARPGRLTLAAGGAFGLAALAIAVVFGVSNSSMQNQINLARAGRQQLAVVLTAQDAHMAAEPVAGGGTAVIVMSRSEHALIFTAQGLHALPASRGYELWLIGPDGTRSAGMLPAGSHGMSGPVMASGLRPGDHLALTAEPADGSARPDTPMMLDMDL
jgi:anti-sigma-K factor RskA